MLLVENLFEEAGLVPACSLASQSKKRLPQAPNNDHSLEIVIMSALLQGSASRWGHGRHVASILLLSPWPLFSTGGGHPKAPRALLI